MTLQEIKDKVRAIMNESGQEESLTLLSEDTVRLDDYIGSCIPDAADIVMLSSPGRYLNATAAAAEVSDADGVGVIVLPEDFLRLVAIRMHEWKRTVFEVLTEGSEGYKIQQNPHTRQGVNKPCCALSYGAEGPVLECYPYGRLAFFHYVKSAGRDDRALGQLKELLHPSVCYMCAGLVYDIFAMAEVGERMKAIAMNLIPKE